MSGADRGISRVLVLGGSGFIGRAVVAELAKQPGIQVRAASRGKFAGVATVDSVQCDVFDRDSLGRALADVDVVINCCRERAGEQEAERFIENLLGAVEAAGVRHLVYLSSVAAYGAAIGAVDEDTAPAEPLNWYGRAKRHAEMACRQRTSENLAITLLRPSLVYGPGGEEWSLDFIRSVRRGQLLGLGPSADGIANLVYVDDLAAFCARLAMRPHSGTALFNANGIEQITFNRYFAEIAAALREHGMAISPARRPPLLAAYARPLARRGLDTLKRALGPVARTGGPIDRRLAAAQHALRHRPEDRAGSRYAQNTRYLPDRAAAAGFVASTSLAAGTRQSVAWAIASGRL